MSNSSYYLELSNEAAARADTLKKEIDTLTPIRNQLRDNYASRQSAVNNKLEDLLEDLEESVRKDSTFAGNISSLSADQKEKSTDADSRLSGALSALEQELSSLETHKSSAESDRDTYRARYQEEKQKEEEEARAYWDAWNRSHGL